MKLTMKPRPVISGNVQYAFSTPIYGQVFPDVEQMNADIEKTVMGWRASEQGVKASNAGGWHSSYDLLQRLGEPHASRLGRMFLAVVKGAIESVAEIGEMPGQFGIEAWANVNVKGDANHAHIHPGCPWSGVYCVSTDQNAGGHIRFTDPRPAALMIAHPLNPFNATNNLRINPVPGLFIAFPSFLYHSVDVYQGERPRISLAFNLR